MFSVQPVALRKESVDRNTGTYHPHFHVVLSLSARRAWIEINMWCSVEKCWAVALRKESVDRNCVGFSLGAKADRSLSARRAWIEISRYLVRVYSRLVALRKESVDRNAGPLRTAENKNGRSPQGERG